MATVKMDLGGLKKLRRFDKVVNIIRNDKESGKGKQKLFYPLLDLPDEIKEEELCHHHCPNEFGVSSDQVGDKDCNCSIDDCIACWMKEV